MAADPVFEHLRELLERHDGLCIGECHDDTEAPHFLARHMRDFADAGVTTLFVECVDATDQDMLDHFQKTGDLEKEFPPLRYHFARALDWELNRWDRPGREGLKPAYLAMLNAARECNIRIIGIDDYTLQGPQRLELSNPVWTKTIQDHLPQQGKYLAHGGYFHFSRLHHAENRIVPVSEHLGVPGIHFSVQEARSVSIEEKGDNPLAADLTVFLPKGQYSVPDRLPQPTISNTGHSVESSLPVLG